MKRGFVVISRHVINTGKNVICVASRITSSAV